MWTFGRHVVTELTRAFAAEVTKDIDRARDFADRFRQCLSFFARHLLAELRQLLSQQIGGLEKILTSLRCRRRGPLLLRRGRRRTSLSNIRFVRRLKRPDYLIDIRRIDIWKRLTRSAFYKLPIDIISKRRPLFSPFMCLLCLWLSWHRKPIRVSLSGFRFGRRISPPNPYRSTEQVYGRPREDTDIWKTLPEKTQKLPRLETVPFKTDAEKKQEEFRRGQSKILQRLAANAPLSEILERLVLLIEAQSPGMLCSVLLLSEDGDHVRHGAAPSLPKEYVEAIDGGAIGPKHGSCGTAMYRGEPVVVTDISVDPLWEDYRDLALAKRTSCVLVHADTFRPWQSSWFVCDVLSGAAHADGRRGRSY